MRDYMNKLVIPLKTMAFCASLLFLGEHSDAGTLQPQEVKNEWIWPADGVISDTYGTRSGKHKGIDIAGKLNTPIYAVDSGTVKKSYFSNTYGNVIFIQHPNHYVTVYAHLSLRSVNEGQAVKKGEMIGKMGSTGQATGVHLHFETHRLEWTYDKKYALNPEKLLGNKNVGDVVLAGSMNNEETAMEAILRYSVREEKDRTMSVKHNNRGAKSFCYVVREGDTLWSIAKRYQLTVKDIQNSNSHIAGDRITPGEKLFLKSNNFYTVQPGDTLSAISRKKNASVAELKKLNHLGSDVIKPNQIIILK